MDRFFDANNPLMRALSGLVDLVTLNLITIVCMIPVFTAGASLTAMNYVLIHYVRGEDTYIGKMFFHSFRDNFKQGIGMGLIYVVFVIIAAIDLYVLRSFDSKAATLLMIVMTVLICFVFVTAVYAFALLSRYDNKTSTTLKNALSLTLGHLPSTAGMIAIWLVWIFVLWYFPKTTVLLGVLFGLSLPAYLCALIYDPVFRRMEEAEEQETFQEP